MKKTYAPRFTKFTALLLCFCLLAGMLPGSVFAAAAYKYSDAAIEGGADSHVYAATIKYRIEDTQGNYLIRYVYSPDIPWEPDVMKAVKTGFYKSYQSSNDINSLYYRELIPVLEEAEDKKGFFFIISGTEENEEYLKELAENNQLDLKDPTAVAKALFPTMSDSVTATDDNMTVTDVSNLHRNDTVTDMMGTPAALEYGKNRVEAVVKESDGAKEMHVTQLSGQTVVTNVTVPRNLNFYQAYRQEVIEGGADANLYAVTIKNLEGGDLSYVYSPDISHYQSLYQAVREGLKAPYKDLIPQLENNEYAEDGNIRKGLLVFSRDQGKYEAMDLNWADYMSVAKALGSENEYPLIQQPDYNAVFEGGRERLSRRGINRLVY